MAKSPFTFEATESGVEVGVRMRSLRAAAGLSMRVLAEKSGLNVNTLSLIENGKTSPSVGTLQQLADALGVPVTEFFVAEQESLSIVCQKDGERVRILFEQGFMEDLGAGMARMGAEPLIVTFEAYANSGKHPIVHTGREFVYCLDGRVAYIVENQTYLLEPGDSLLFEAYLPHRWKNECGKPARVLLVLCPLDERDRPAQRHFLR